MAKVLKSQLLFLMIAIWSTAAGANPPADPEISRLVESIREKKANAGMAVAVVRGREILHLSTHGYADAEGQLPIGENTLFMIGSTTKAMTATAAGYLVQDQRMSWDTPVRQLVPSFRLKDPAATEQATLRDLLLHRTGLPRHDFAWLSRNWTSEQYLELLPLLEPSAGFREVWQYQNLMYMVAGLMVGAAEQKSWGEVLTERLFKNLGMEHSRALAADLLPSDDLARPHEWVGQKFVRISPRPIDGVGPAGSVHSSITDMIRWTQFNLRKGEAPGGKNLDASIMAEIHRPQMMISRGARMPEFGSEQDYGLGWIVTKYRDQTYISHGGGIDGFTTSVAFLPDADLGIVVLTNGGELAPDVVTFSVLDRMLGAESVNWLERFYPPTGNTPEPVERQYPASYEGGVGEFVHPAYGTIATSIVDADGQKLLRLDLNGGFDFDIMPWVTDDPKVWAFEYSWIRVMIHLDESGRAVRIETNLEPTVADLLFERVR
jgi:CubicO group peptidase (beta-lactamase class C family)